MIDMGMKMTLPFFVFFLDINNDGLRLYFAEGFDFCHSLIIELEPRLVSGETLEASLTCNKRNHTQCHKPELQSDRDKHWNLYEAGFHAIRIGCYGGIEGMFDP